MSRQRVKYRPRGVQIRCLESFCDPIVDWRENLSGIVRPVLLYPQSGKAHNHPGAGSLGTSCFFGKRSLAAPLCLLLHQRPDAIPLGTWGGDAELSDTFEE